MNFENSPHVNARQITVQITLLRLTVLTGVCVCTYISCYFYGTDMILDIKQSCCFV